MIAAMSSAVGPFGPGLRRGDEEEKSRRHAVGIQGTAKLLGMPEGRPE